MSVIVHREDTQDRNRSASTRELARRLALGAVAGPILFTVAWLVLGSLSPGFSVFGTRIAPYSAISHPISGLGLGPTGPFMNAAFILGGLLILAGIVGIFQGVSGESPAARWTCAMLLALSPLGMVIDGLFTLESFLLHMTGFLLGTGSLVVTFLAAGFFFRDIPRWRRLGNWLLVGSPLTLALLILSFATYDQAAAATGLGVAGLTQRFLVVEVQTWFVAMGWLGSRHS